MKHTKGKWEINRDKYELFINSESGMICNINDLQSSNIENAKLIAAAPELLEAINEIMLINSGKKSGNIYEICKESIKNYITHKRDIIYRGVNPIPKFIEYN